MEPCCHLQGGTTEKSPEQKGSRREKKGSCLWDLSLTKGQKGLSSDYTPVHFVTGRAGLQPPVQKSPSVVP